MMRDSTDVSRLLANLRLGYDNAYATLDLGVRDIPSPPGVGDVHKKTTLTQKGSQFSSMAYTSPCGVLGRGTLPPPEEYVALGSGLGGNLTCKTTPHPNTIQSPPSMIFGELYIFRNT